MLILGTASVFGDEIESIETLELKTGKRITTVDHAAIFPANLYLAPQGYADPGCA